MQLCEDREFLTKILYNESCLGVTLQTNSDTSQSDSHFDCSVLLSQSDDNESDHSDSHTYKKFHTENPPPLASKVGDSDLNTQTAINEQILHQLSFLSQHLDSMERTTSKNQIIPKRLSSQG